MPYFFCFFFNFFFFFCCNRYKYNVNGDVTKIVFYCCYCIIFWGVSILFFLLCMFVCLKGTRTGVYARLAVWLGNRAVIVLLLLFGSHKL